MMAVGNTENKVPIWICICYVHGFVFLGTTH
jgi:hypothetical protein